MPNWLWEIDCSDQAKKIVELVSEKGPGELWQNVSTQTWRVCGIGYKAKVPAETKVCDLPESIVLSELLDLMNHWQRFNAILKACMTVQTKNNPRPKPAILASI